MQGTCEAPWVETPPPPPAFCPELATTWTGTFYPLPRDPLSALANDLTEIKAFGVIT